MRASILLILLKVMAASCFVPAADRRHHRHEQPSRVYSTPAVDEVSQSTKQQQSPSDSYDVIVVGSGIGGLSCAAMLAKYSYSVAVFESHNTPGGAAHGFSMRVPTVGDFVCDTGPSFFSGPNPFLPAKASNPLRTILDAIDEQVECDLHQFWSRLPPRKFRSYQQLWKGGWRFGSSHEHSRDATVESSDASHDTTGSCC